MATKKNATKNPTKQGSYKVGYKKPPQDKQFGKESGNPRHNGSWRKEDTTRFKLQQIAKMSKEQLQAVVDDQSGVFGMYEQEIARTILQLPNLDAQKRWAVIEGLTNQDCGYPKQQVEQKNIELTPILPKKKKG